MSDNTFIGSLKTMTKVRYANLVKKKLTFITIVVLLSISLILWYDSWLHAVSSGSYWVKRARGEIAEPEEGQISNFLPNQNQWENEPLEIYVTLESKLTEPTKGESNIFFVEATCVTVPLNFSYNGLYLHQRQACTIESAARANPDYKVYILYTCSVNGELKDSADNVKGVLSYPNVKLWKLNFTELFEGSPLENWDFLGAIKTSQFPAVHCSDIVRVCALWKWGGTYLDLDIVVFRSLAPLGSNYLAFYAPKAIANGILNFDTDGIGHKYATMCLEEVTKTFQGDDWYQNGFFLVVRVLLDLCGVMLVDNLTPEKCKGFKVLPPRDFFPVPYELYQEHYDPTKRDKILNMLNGSYGLHLNNNFIKEWRIPLRMNHAYDYMSNKYCPRSYSGAGPTL